MTIQKITKKSSFSSSIKLGRGSYAKATDRSYILHPVPKQNSIEKVAVALYKYYKTS
jgi:hypothetical protein